MDVEEEWKEGRKEMERRGGCGRIIFVGFALYFLKFKGGVEKGERNALDLWKIMIYEMGYWKVGDCELKYFYGDNVILSF